MSQHLSQGMNDPMCRVVCARAQMEHWKDVGAGVDDEPEPQDVLGTPEPGANFVQLQVREVQGAEGALMEEFSVLACPREPPRDGRLTGAENPLGSRWVQSFGKPQTGPWRPGTGGGVQPVEGRVATGA